MDIADSHAAAPACNRTFAAVKLELCLRKNVSCRLIKIDLAVGKFGQVYEAILQTKQAP